MRKIEYNLTGETDAYFNSEKDAIAASKIVFDYYEKVPGLSISFDFSNARYGTSEEGYITRVRYEELRHVKVDADTYDIDGEVIEKSDVNMRLYRLVRNALKDSHIGFDLSDEGEYEGTTVEELMEEAKSEEESAREHEQEMEHGW